MRKWSANWTGFKKEHMSGFNATENAPDGDNTPPQSGPSLFAPTRRGNYADVRAAVAGRREKAHSDQGSDTGSSTPRKSYEVSDTDQQEGPSTPARSTTLSRSSSPAISAQMTSPFRKDSIRAMPSPPKVTTDVHAAEVSTPVTVPSPDVRELGLPLQLPIPPIQAAPIKVQPSQGASMTIPGIHASHRNDVMSMGYVPPPPSTPATPDSKARAPTIQSMYRLFKTPSGNSTASNGGTGNATATPETTEGESQASVHEETASKPDAHSNTSESSDTTPLPTVEVKRTPPPLPPRSNSKSLAALATSEPTASSDAEKATSSSASEALKLIATQDDEIRKAVQGAGADTRRRDSVGPGNGRRVSTYGSETADNTLVQDRGALNAPETNLNGDASSSRDANKPVKPIPPPLPPRKEHHTIA